MRQHRVRVPGGFPGTRPCHGERSTRPDHPRRAGLGPGSRARSARLTLANALVTLNFTMWGIMTERFKTGLILVVATVTLCLAWFILPHFSFVVFVACASAAGLFVLCAMRGGRYTGSTHRHHGRGR